MTSFRPHQRSLTRRLFVVVLSILFSGETDQGNSNTQVVPPVREARSHHEAGVAYHLNRCLDQATVEYVKALKLEPPRELRRDEWQLVRRFAPRVYVTASEFFPLKDFAVILHPSEKLIAYHFFWEDDVDFPDDNDPCDHELIWVQYSEDRSRLERVWTYFHGRILDGGKEAIEEAERHNMRPRINVQWGKHGSMPVVWQDMQIQRDSSAPEEQAISLKRYNQESFQKLSTEGCRMAEHPLARRAAWPRRFAGDWEAFVNFSRVIEPLKLLDQNRMALVSRWNSGTINQYFLRYNFRPKTEWPQERGRGQ